MNVNGKYWVLRKKIAASSSGANEIVPAVPGKKIVVINFHFLTNSAVTVEWKSGTTSLTGAHSYAANLGSCPNSPYGLIETAAGEALNMTLGGAVGVNGFLSYILE